MSDAKERSVKVYVFYFVVVWLGRIMFIFLPLLYFSCGLLLNIFGHNSYVYIHFSNSSLVLGSDSGSSHLGLYAEQWQPFGEYQSSNADLIQSYDHYRPKVWIDNEYCTWFFDPTDVVHIWNPMLGNEDPHYFIDVPALLAVLALVGVCIYFWINRMKQPLNNLFSGRDT